MSQKSSLLQPAESVSRVLTADNETKAPFIEVATIRIPKQRFDSDAQQTFCENLSYTPWHALAEHRPAGGINRIRKVVYEGISVLRHKLNKTPRIEPTGDETFN